MENQAGFVEDYICIQRRLAAKQAKESEDLLKAGRQNAGQEELFLILSCVYL